MKSPFYTANADAWLRYSLCVESNNMKPLYTFRHFTIQVIALMGMMDE